MKAVTEWEWVSNINHFCRYFPGNVSFLERKTYRCREKQTSIIKKLPNII